MTHAIALVATLTLVALSTLYSAATFLAASEANVQLVSMMRLDGRRIGTAFQYGYTALMLSAAGAAVLLFIAKSARRSSAITLYVTGTLAVLATAFPLTYSFLYNWRPRFYEYYVGESVTLVALVIAVSCAFVVQQQGKTSDAVSRWR